MDDDSSVILEIEANEFAWNLLVPDQAVRDYLDAHPEVTRGDNRAFVEMAYSFGVPFIVLGLRLGDLRRKK